MHTSNYLARQAGWPYVMAGAGLLFCALFSLAVLIFAAASSLHAQEPLPWKRGQAAPGGNGRVYSEPGEPYDPARHGGQQGGYGDRQSDRAAGNYYGRAGSNNDNYDRGYDALRSDRRHYETRPYERRGRAGDYSGRYDENGRDNGYYGDNGRSREGDYRPPASSGPGRPYEPPHYYGDNHRPPARRLPPREERATYSDDEIIDAGHRFFGKITKGLAKVVAHLFKQMGRPNAYILGEEGSGALIAGLRYGEGTIYTKWGERRHIYWQGPSIGYDFGAEGAKTMILVYNLGRLDDIFERFGGVDGSAYLVGGVGVTLQKRGRVVLAPIRTGVGLRLGANLGYLKYTRRPTWNPF